MLWLGILIGCSNNIISEPAAGETIRVSLGNTIAFGNFEIELGEEIGFAPSRYIDAFYIPLTITNVGETLGHPDLLITSFGPDRDWLRNASFYFDDDFLWFWDWMSPGERIESKLHFQYIGDGEYTLEINSHLQDGDISSRELGFFELMVEVAWPDDIALLEEEGAVRDFGVELVPDSDQEEHAKNALDSLGAKTQEYLVEFLNSLPDQNVSDNAANLELGDTFMFGNFEITIGEEIGFTTLGNTDVFYVPVTITNMSRYRDYHWLWSNTFRLGPSGNSVSITGREFPESDIYGLGELEPGASDDARIYMDYIGNAQYILEFQLREDMTHWARQVTNVFELVFDVRKP